MKLIDKDALVAEIENLKENARMSYSDYADGRLDVCKGLLSFLDTLEVKEVDYDKVLTEYLGNFENASIGHRLSIRRTAKHFFELGLNASNPLTWEDINSILYIERLVLREFGYQEYSNEELCKEVLKRFKEQKGE